MRGWRFAELTATTVAEILAEYPRLDFKRGFTELIEDQAERKPRCWAAVAMGSGLGEDIVATPFES